MALKHKKDSPNSTAEALAFTESFPNSTASSSSFPGLCKYKSGKCFNHRAIKKNGTPHTLCDYHRGRQNAHQRKSDRKAREIFCSRKKSIIHVLSGKNQQYSNETYFMKEEPLQSQSCNCIDITSNLMESRIYECTTAEERNRSVSRGSCKAKNNGQLPALPSLAEIIGKRTFSRLNLNYGSRNFSNPHCYKRMKTELHIDVKNGNRTPISNYTKSSYNTIRDLRSGFGNSECIYG